MNMRANERFFVISRASAREMTKNIEGGSHIHIPLRFFEITGLFRDQQHKKTCYKPSSQSLTKAFHCISVLVTRGDQRENDVISKQKNYRGIHS